jgi:hypothetical protein
MIPDIYVDERVPHEAYRPTFVKSMVMVPIRKVDPIGAIGNYWAAERMATEKEVFLLQALADSTSIAMENVRPTRSSNSGCGTGPPSWKRRTTRSINCRSPTS